MGCRGDLDLGRCQRGVGTATAGAYTGSSSGVILISDSTVPAPYTLRTYAGLHVPQCRSTMGQGQWRLGEVIGCEEQRRLRPEAVSEQGGGSHCWHLHRWNIRDSLDLCLELPITAPTS